MSNKSNITIDKNKEIEIAIMYAEGNTINKIATMYGISYERVSRILKKKLISQIIKDRQEQIRKTIKRAYSKVDKRFIDLVDRYSNEALNEERIEKTPLKDLFSVLTSFSNRFENLQKYEIELKRLEIEREKLEIERERVKNKNVSENADNDFLKEFYESVKKNSSINK